MVTTEIALSALLGVVQEAAQAVMDVYNSQSAVVELKGDNSPVTQADIAAHHILTSRIQRLYPHIPMISEEGDAQENRRAVQQQLFWLIDPLDGTKEFLARNSDFTICIALIEGDAPSFGLIAAPALGVTYYGGPNSGSFKITGTGEPVPIHVARGSTGVVLGSISHLNRETSDYLARHYPEHRMQAAGSQLKLAYIAEGLADACPRLNHAMRLWDLAPGQAILAGAGGSVTRPDGSPIDYHTPSLLADDFVATS